MNAPRVAVLVLAAGRSSRMGAGNKLLATFDGVPLVRRSVETALACTVARRLLVVGHEAERVSAAVAGLPIEIVENPSFAQGMSTSLRLGFEMLAPGVEGVLVMLADQPGLRPSHLDALVEQFRPEGHGSIVVATANGRRGNPAVLSTRFAAEIAAVSDDKGARDVIETHRDFVREMEIGPAALLDVDTPEALAAAGGVPPDDAMPRRS